LGYGAVTCVNLFCFRCQKINLSKDVDIKELTNDENEQEILRAVRETDITIFAVGTLAKTYKRAEVYQNRLFDLLREYQNKVHVIAAPDGTEGLHPLSAKLRATGSWTLTPFKIPDPLSAVKTESQVDTDISKKKKSKQGKRNENVTPSTS
jgi:hypothetical protein